MFKSKIIVIFFIALIITATAWKVSLDNKPQSEIVKTSLFPALIDSINEITEVTIADRRFESILKKIDGVWYLHNKDNYPASTSGIKQLALELSNLKILEAKTSSVEKYAKLGVNDLSIEGSRASQITVSANKKKLVSLLIGLSPKEAKKAQRYIRLVDQATAQLVAGQISAPTNPIEWLDPQIIDVDSKSIERLTIDVPGEKKIVISKNTESEDFFTLQKIPESFEMKSKTIVSSIPAILMDLRLNDVISANVVSDLEPSQQTTVTTFSGLEILLTDYIWKDKPYTVFAASRDNDNKEITDATIEKINNKVNGWAYEIPSYKRRMINRKFEDLIQLIEKPD
jgi:hypothetical protein